MPRPHQPPAPGRGPAPARAVAPVGRLPAWAGEVVVAFDAAALEPEPVCCTATLRRARKFSRLLLASDPAPELVQAFLTAFDSLIAQQHAKLDDWANAPVIAALRARAGLAAPL